jgi:hypothetical protein
MNSKIIGENFLQKLKVRDFDGLQGSFHTDVTGRLLISPGLMTVYDSTNLVKKIKQWFGNADHFELMNSTISQVANSLSVNYKFKIHENNVWYECEQQTFSEINDEKIKSFDLLCSGFQKIE